MRVRFFLLVWVVFVLHAAEPTVAAPPDDEAVKKEFAKLEGVWEMVPPVGAKDAGMSLEFKGGKLKVTWIGDGSLEPEIKIYPDTTPRCIDIEFKKVRREHYEGIYQIDGDTLKLILAPSDVKDRPTTIPDEPEAGKGYLHGVFKRKK